MSFLSHLYDTNKIDNCQHLLVLRKEYFLSLHHNIRHQHKKRGRFLMRIQWMKKDVSLTPAMISWVRDQATVIQERFPKEEFTLTISLNQDKRRRVPSLFTVKGVLRDGVHTVVVDSQSEDFYSALDEMMEVIAINYEKERERRETLRRNEERIIKELLHPTPEELEDEGLKLEELEDELLALQR